MNIVDNPEEYRYIVTAGVRSPGVVTLSGHDRAVKWDTKPAPGQVGATNSFTGIGLGEFTALFELATADELDAWADYQQLLKSTFSGPTPKALPIYHPDLAENDFTEVVVKSLGGKTYTVDLMCRVRVVFVEFRPSRDKRVSKATAQSRPNRTVSQPGGASEDNDPNAAARAELASLVEQANAP